MKDNLVIILQNHREMARNKIIRARLEDKRQYWRGYLDAIIAMEKVNYRFRRREVPT